MSAERNRVDHIQQRLVDYAAALDYATLPPEAVHAAKVRVIDTLAQHHAYWWDHTLLHGGAFEIGYWSRNAERFALYLQRRRVSWDSLIANEAEWFPDDLRELYVRVLDPPTLFTLPDIGVKFALISLIGGIGTIIGPVVGAILIVPLETWLRGAIGGDIPGGHLIVLERMDGGRFHTLHSSTTKAVCAASNKRATTAKGAVGQDLDVTHALGLALAAGPERWTAMEGGAPVIVDGECIGGVGVAGADWATDERIARAAVEAIGATWRIDAK